MAILPFALVFYLCRGFFVNGWPSPAVLAGFFASLVMAFLLGYFLEAMIGLIGFWFLEVSSLMFIYMLVNFLLSGQLVPLDMFDKLPLAGSITWGDGAPCRRAIWRISPRRCFWARSTARSSSSGC